MSERLEARQGFNVIGAPDPELSRWERDMAWLMAVDRGDDATAERLEAEARAAELESAGLVIVSSGIMKVNAKS